MKNKLLLLTMLLATVSCTVWARDYHFRHYTNDVGLSHNTVNSIIQDTRGFMWFGTKDGLNRFDGKQFKSYYHRNSDSTSIRNNYVLSLTEDSEGLIWIGTYSGLSYFDPQTELFHNLDAYFSYSGEIIDIVEDFRKNIWIQSFQGLYRYDKENKTMRFYSSSTYFTPNYMCVIQQGDLWISGNNGNLYNYQYGKDDFNCFPILTTKEKEEYSGRFILADAGKHGLLIGTEEKGLKLFNPNTLSAIEIIRNDNSGNPIYIRSILPYSEDEYWLGSESGIHILNMKDRNLISLQKNLRSPYSLNNNAVYTLTKDREGGVWAGTYFKGVNYLPPETTPFEKHFYQGRDSDIKGSIVREITQDDSGNLWIGTEDEGINMYDISSKKFSHFPADGKPGSISKPNIHGLLVHKDKLWIGHFNNGVDVFDIKTKKVIKNYSTSNSNLSSNFVVTIHRTKDDKILLGTIFGLFQYDEAKDDFIAIDDLAKNSFIYTILEDHAGTMWVGTLNKGLFAKTKEGKIINFVHNEADSTSICSDAITDIYEDRNNKLWIGTRGNGLCEYDRSKSEFIHHTVDKDFPSNFVYKILEDAVGNLWISTSNGLLCFNPSTYAIKQYTTANGIINNQFNYNSGYKDRFGKMYFGSIDGMIAISPEDIKEVNIPLPTYITSFYVFDEEISLHDKEGELESIIMADKAILNHNQSTFTIRFASPSYVSPNMIEHRYMLEGLDSKWTYLKHENIAHFTNIPSGEYVFKVQSSNGNNNWENEVKSLTIVIKTPWWKSIWAYLCYSLILYAIIYMGFRFYSQRLTLKNNLELDKMTAEKEKTLLNAKIDFFTQIAHEIRTPLTLIKGSVDRIIKVKDNLEAKQELVEENIPILNKNTERLLNLSNQLLDFRKTEQEGMKLNFTKIDVADLIKQTHIRFSPISKEKSIRFTYSVPDEGLNAIVDKEALTKILSNLYSNALKFAESWVAVNLSLDEQEVNLIISVQNDSIVIPEDVHQKIFEPFFQYKHKEQKSLNNGVGIGLFLARSLCELHGGSLKLDTSKHVNSFVVTLPKEQDYYIDLTSYTTSESDAEELIENIDTQHPEEDKDKLTILLVEDETDMLDFVAQELESNYRIIKAKNGSEALSLLDKNLINAIISDISMPQMDGYELCKRIKSNLHFSHIPFVMLTAKQNVSARIKGLELGADAYVVKPFSTQHLIAQLENLLESKKKLLESFTTSPFVYTSTIVSNKADIDFLDTLTDIVNSNLENPELGVEFLSETLGLSTSSLYRKVKGMSDISPNDFIRLIRLKKAAELLTKDQITIKEVAYLTGFSTPSYFSACFTKQFNIKPSDFIKRYNK